MEFPTDKIYKFSSFNENSISALAGQSVWFSDVESLNDAFEVAVDYSLPENEEDKVQQYIAAATKELKTIPSVNDLEEYALQTYLNDPDRFINITNNAVEIVKQKHSDFLNSLSIYSMSLDLPDTAEHYKNMLMWAHYADGFTGFCLQFSATNFCNSIKEVNTERKIGYCKVDYVSEVHKVNVIDFINDTDTDYFKSIQCKHDKWDYEGEFRFISDKFGLHKYAPDALEKVYLGFKMPDNKKKVVIAIIKQYFVNVEIYEANIDKSSYKVTVNKI